MKLVHAADLHIDSPLLGLERYEGAPIARARDATRAAFRKVIDLCLTEGARFLVLAGDVFDGDWRDANTGLFFVSELARLREIGCHVLLLRGNHDHALTRTLLYRLPDHVHTFGTPRQKDQHRFVFENDGVVFHGVSYGEKRVTDSLLPHYASPTTGLLNVGVLHTNCVGAAGSNAHDRYAPCTADELAAHGYQYWALGHVHTHEVLRRDPFIVYPGNTQGRHAREIGPKGCVVIETVGARIDDIRFVETCSMRYAHLNVALAVDDDEDALYEKVARAFDAEAAHTEQVPSAVRLEVSGAAAAHAAVVRDPDRVATTIRALALERGEGMWLEKVRLDTRPVVSLEDLRASAGLVGELLRSLELLRTEEGEPDLQALAARALGPLRAKLKGEADAIQLALTDTPTLVDLLDRAEALLAERLTEREEEIG